MPISFNPQTGEAFALDANGGWVPTKIARNPQTGESFALDGQDWKPIPSATPKPEKSALESVHDLVGGSADAATQGAAFAFADEVGAGVRAGARGVTNLMQGKDADFGGNYDRALQDIRGREAAFAEEHPYISTTANVLGGLATGGRAALPRGTPVPAAQSLTAATPALQAAGATGQSVAGAVGRSVGTGAGYGALGGFGAGEGGFENRLMSAGTGAMLGAGLGAALPAAGAAANKGFGLARNVLGLQNSRNAALDQLGRGLRRDDATPFDVGRTLDATDKPMTILDAAGHRTQALGRTVETIPGRGSTRAHEFLHDRQKHQGERVTDDIADDLSGDDFYRTLDDLDQQRRTAAAPAYEAFYAQPLIWSPAIDAILTRPSGKNALNRAYRIAAEEGRDPRGLGLDLDVDGNVRIIPTQASNQTLDYVKRGLDDVVEASRDKVTGKLVLDTEGKAVNATRADFITVVDRLSDTGNGSLYKAARDAWGGPTQSMEATRLGRLFARGDDEVTIDRFRRLSPGDQAMFRVGVARELTGTVAKSRDGHDVVGRIFGSRDQRARLRALFPDQASFARFEKAMADEAKMNQSKNIVTGNSVTGRIAAEQEDAGQLANAAMDYAGGGIAGAAFGLARRGIARAKGLTEASADELAKMLFEADKGQQRRILAELLRRSRQTERFANRGVRALQAVGATGANLTGQALANEGR